MLINDPDSQPKEGDPLVAHFDIPLPQRNKGVDGEHPIVAGKRSIGGIAFTGGAAIFLFVVGLALILEVPLTIYRQEAAWQWPSAPGQILSVSRSIRSGIAVRYDYYVAGRRYEDSSGNLPHVNRAKLRAGSEVMIRYKPNDPRISVFDPGFPLGSVRELLYGLGSLFLSAFMATVCISSYRDPANISWSFRWGVRRRIP